MDPYQEFERVIRAHCLLADGSEFDADATMTSLGIESAQVVGLVMELEDAFTVEFSNSLFTPENFATPSALWAALQNELKSP
jgi:acyl carrier protein